MHYDGYLHTDGAARGNPGPAAAGAVVAGPDGSELGRAQLYLGKATNNQAEYLALLLGLDLAHRLQLATICCRLDSELLVKQLNGQYRIKHPRLRELADKVKVLMGKFDAVGFEHVRRSHNQAADGLANAAIDAFM